MDFMSLFTSLMSHLEERFSLIICNCCKHAYAANSPTNEPTKQ